MAKPYKYTRKVSRIGHSLMISLPSIWVKANTLEEVKSVEIEVYDDRLVVRPIEDERKTTKNRSR